VQSWRGALANVFEYRYFLPAVTVAGVLLRLALLLAVRHSQGFPDEQEYQNLAVTLLHEHRFAMAGWPSAYKAPGEPMFLAGVYALVGQRLVLAKVLQEFVLAMVPVFCWRLARLLGMAVGWANLAALLGAFDPALNYAATTIYPTALTAVALTAGVFYAALAARDDASGAAIKSGIGFGAAGLLTTTFAPLALLVGLYLAWKRKMRVALIVCVVGMLPAAVWMARNRGAMGEWILSTNGGVNLYLGANDAATPRSGNWVEVPFSIRAGGVEVPVEKEYTQAAEGWIRVHPGRWVELSVCRAVLVVDSVGRPVTAGLHSSRMAQVVGWAMLPVVLLGVAGLWIFRRCAAAWFVAMALGLVTVSGAATIVKPRFRFPCDPLLMTFAAGVLAKVAGRSKSALGGSSEAVDAE
jgi:hypothetical protein